MAGERECAGSRWMPPWVWLEHRARYDFAARFVAGRTVVDCACGGGFGALTFARAGARRVLAFDLSGRTLAEARRARQHPAIHYVRASALAVPVRAAGADVFVALETIEHLADDRGFLAEVARVLGPEGVLICSTPNRAVTNPGRTLADQPQNPFHLREYARDELAELLSEHFAAVELYGQNPGAVVIPRLTRLLPAAVAARLNQARKLSRLLFDPSQHLVEHADPGKAWEYLTAVCRKRPSAPRSAAPTGTSPRGSYRL